MYHRSLLHLSGFWIDWGSRDCSVEFEELAAETWLFLRADVEKDRVPLRFSFVLPCSVDLVATQPLRLLCWGRLLMLLALISPSFLSMAGHTYSQKILSITWAVNTVQKLWNTPYLISVCSSVASSGQLRLCLVASTRSQRRNFWLTVWRVLRLATEWRFALNSGWAIFTNEISLTGLVDVVAKIVIRLWPLVLSYLKETDQKDEGDRLVVRTSVLGNPNCGFNSVFIVVLLFRRRRWTGICTSISLRWWNSDCFISSLKSLCMSSRPSSQYFHVTLRFLTGSRKILGPH